MIIINIGRKVLNILSHSQQFLKLVPFLNHLRSEQKFPQNFPDNNCFLNPVFSQFPLFLSIGLAEILLRRYFCLSSINLTGNLCMVKATIGLDNDLTLLSLSITFILPDRGQRPWPQICSIIFFWWMSHFAPFHRSSFPPASLSSRLWLAWMTTSPFFSSLLSFSISYPPSPSCQSPKTSTCQSVVQPQQHNFLW